MAALGRLRGPVGAETGLVVGAGRSGRGSSITRECQQKETVLLESC